MRFKQKFAYVAILSLFAAPLQAYAVDAFKVGDTQIKLGGYVDLDYHQTHASEGHIDGESIARDFYIPSVIPTGSGDGEGWDTADLTAQSSRFNVGFSREINGKRAIGFLELDFLGVGSNERVVNGHAPRLRRAYIKYAGWLLGQEWTTFQNLSAIPEDDRLLKSLTILFSSNFMMSVMVRFDCEKPTVVSRLNTAQFSEAAWVSVAWR